MVDITREEAEEFNDDVQCVIERLKEFDLIREGDEESANATILASAAIVNQLFLRWFGFEDTLANIEDKRYVKRFIAVLNGVRDSVPLPASSKHPRH